VEGGSQGYHGHKGEAMNFIMERKKLSEMTPAGYNPREIRAEALSGLGGSIEKFGVIVPIVWNKRTGNIVGGHQRYKVLTDKGVEETDVVVVDLDDNEEVALNITLNNPATRGMFTKSVVRLLEQSKQEMADEFQKVGLDDMLNYLSRFKFEEKAGGESKEKKSTGTGRPKEGMMCPKCRSVWKKETGEIVSRSGVSNG